ncbi:MAG: hypothetical protein O7E52_11415, partial [Candidatus Poribacteria bacterium]|nr:hypothetical protein [Candidatus Poribacteria bacterium]
IGYISHRLLDLCTLDGIVLTYPLAPYHRWVLPTDADSRIKTRSPRERVFRFIGLLLLVSIIPVHLAGGRSMFHSFLGTAAAIGRDDTRQLKRGYRLVVTIDGIWAQRQVPVSTHFDVVAATEDAIFVRRPSDPFKIYRVSGAGTTAIAHATIKIARRIPAQHRVVHLPFRDESWKPELVAQYPRALVTGVLWTGVPPPRYDFDEFPTITGVGNRWELVDAPIEFIDGILRPSDAKLREAIQIRYWQDQGRHR